MKRQLGENGFFMQEVVIFDVDKLSLDTKQIGKWAKELYDTVGLGHNWSKTFLLCPAISNFDMGFDSDQNPIEGNLMQSPKEK